mgnify:CR=1 FL=1
MAKPRIRSVKFNVLMNMILTSSSLLFPLITVPYVSRVLSTYGTGAVAFAQSVVTYFPWLLCWEYHLMELKRAHRSEMMQLSCLRR